VTGIMGGDVDDCDGIDEMRWLWYAMLDGYYKYQSKGFGEFRKMNEYRGDDCDLSTLFIVS
jgi:hypothetical protein